jgi:hypothetical protein
MAWDTFLVNPRGHRGDITVSYVRQQPSQAGQYFGTTILENEEDAELTEREWTRTRTVLSSKQVLLLGVLYGIAGAQLIMGYWLVSALFLALAVWMTWSILRHDH